MKLGKRNKVLVSFMLFSLFFGAGNLIFPPFLGQNAGSATLPAMLGFLLTAVVLPVLGVIVVARFDGLDRLAQQVGPRFALVFTLLIYLSIGPGLGIPRAASVPFEMAVAPYLPEDANATLWMVVYSLLFFLVALWLCLTPGKLVSRIGHVLTPSLLALLVFLFISFLARGQVEVAASQSAYQSAPFLKGFAEGYQTMDTIAALNFGIIIAINIQAKGVDQEGAIVRETIRAGIIAGILLALIYAALAHIGAPAGAAAGSMDNGARILTFVAGNLFGNAGMMILGLIFLIACFNTCVGLLSCCSQYFNSIIPVIGYRVWVFLFALISLIISSAGLNKILAVSVPVLNAIYPIAIVLIVLAFLGPLTRRWPAMYPAAILFTGAVSVVYALEQSKFVIPFLTQATTFLPGYGAGLGWIVPAFAGMAAGIIYSSVMGDQEE